MSNTTLQFPVVHVLVRDYTRLRLSSITFSASTLPYVLGFGVNAALTISP